MSASDFASSIRHMAESDAQADFTSGEKALDMFFAKHAYRNSRRGLGVTYVMPRGESHASSLPPVLGFYTISTADIASEQASQVLKNLPRYPTPAALIGRLAVDQRAQGRGVGRALLVDALVRVLEVRNAIGCAVVVVDAKNADAEAFYAKFGFVAMKGSSLPRRMLIALTTVEQAI